MTQTHEQILAAIISHQEVRLDLQTDTAKTAIDELEAQGLIEKYDTAHGSTFVTATKAGYKAHSANRDAAQAQGKLITIYRLK